MDTPSITPDSSPIPKWAKMAPNTTVFHLGEEGKTDLRFHLERLNDNLRVSIGIDRTTEFAPVEVRLNETHIVIPDSTQDPPQNPQEAALNNPRVRAALQALNESLEFEKFLKKAA